MTIKTIECEALLRWVYREELPKRQGDPSWATMFSSAAWQQQCRVDCTSSGEYAPIGAGAPHPDALLIDHVVSGLEPVTLLWEYCCDQIMGPFANAVRHDPALKRMEFQPAGLLCIHAQLGQRPMWDIGSPSIKQVGAQPKVWFLDQDGNQVTGSKRGGYYSSGACCPIRYEPSLTEIAGARSEYYVWRESMIRVTQLLSTLKLTEYRAAPPSAAALPWVTGETDKPNIIKDKSPAQQFINHNRKMPLIPRRPLTTLPASRPPRYPVRHILSLPPKS